VKSCLKEEKEKDKEKEKKENGEKMENEEKKRKMKVLILPSIIHSLMSSLCKSEFLIILFLQKYPFQYFLQARSISNIFVNFV
jgi:hypothetical protein